MPTILEILKGYPALSNVGDAMFEKVFVDREITDGAADYTFEHKKVVDLAAADLYVLIANSPDFSEGQLSIKFPRETLLSSAAGLYALHGELKTGTIRAVLKW